MGISVPLKLKDSAGLQSIDSDNYDFLAYRAGLQLVGLDSNAVAGYGIRDANTDKRDIGDIINTFYDSATGTHGPDALFSTTSITTNLYQGTGTLEYTDSNYRNFVYQTDSANDSGSQKILQAFTDDDWTNLNNNIVSRMVKKDYPGVIYLGDSDFDSANGSWSKLISNFYSDTRTSGDAVNYHIWQKQYLTDSAPADSAKPFTMKYRADSAEINIAGRFGNVGEDSGELTEVYFPTTEGVISGDGANRVSIGMTLGASGGDFSGSPSTFLIALNQEYLNKILGVHPLVPSTSNFPDLKNGVNGQKTQFSAPTSRYTNSVGQLSNGPFTVFKDSANDTTLMPRQTWFGIKAKINLTDSDRFGSTDATFAATDSIMQQYANSDGTHTLQFNFQETTRFALNKITDTGGLQQGGTNLFFFQREDGADSSDDTSANKIVATSRAGRNVLRFEGRASTSVFGDSDAHILEDSDTFQILSRMRKQNKFAELRGNSQNLLDSAETTKIGHADSDEIYLILKNDFLGFQLADSDQLDETLNKRVRNYLADTTSATNPPIGTYLLRSSGDGTPSQSGILGTWEPKGVATDFRNQIIDVNYTRTSTTVFDRIRSSSFTAIFSADYTGERTSNFTDGFLGNYLGNYTRERDQNFDITRTSSYEGQYIGNYTGNYTGEITASAISTVGSGSYPRTIIQTGGVPAGNYTGDGGTGYLGTGSTETARTIVVAETTVTNGTLGTFYGSYVVQTGQYGTSGYGSGFSGSFSKDGVTYTITSHGYGFGAQGFATSPAAPSGTAVTIEYTGGGYTQSATSNGTSWSLSGGGSPPYAGNPGTYTLGWNVKGDSTTYSISSQTAGTGWSNNAATIDASDGRVSSPAQTKSFDFVRDYDGNYDGNYSTDYEGNYTGDFLGNYEGEFQRITTADYTGDFLGNYDGEYSTDYEGNYEGAYETDYVGNYDGNFTGNYTANFIGTSTTTTGTVYDSNYYWEVRIAGPGDSSQIYVRYNGTTYVSSYLSETTATNTTTVYLRTSVNQVELTDSGSATPITVNRGSYQTTTGSGYLRYAIASGTADYFGNYAGATYTRTSTRNSTRTSTGTYVGIYDRTRTSLYEGTYTRERNENFQSGDAYSSVYSAVYTGNYEGNYTSDYTGNYEGNYTGDFVGTTIGTDKSGDAYETFTLYVRTD